MLIPDDCAWCKYREWIGENNCYCIINCNNKIKINTFSNIIRNHPKCPLREDK